MSDSSPPPLPQEIQDKNQRLTRGAGEELECLQELQLDGGLVVQSGHGEEQRLSQVTALQQLQPVARRGWLEACRDTLK